MNLGDVDLELASGGKTSVLKELERMKLRWDAPDVREARDRAKRAELHVYNRAQGRSSVLEDIVSSGPMQGPLVSKNKLRGNALTWAARVTKARTNGFAAPHEVSEKDEAVSLAANAILDSQRQLQDRDALLARAGLDCCLHGTVAFYTTHDPDSGPHRERNPVMDPFGMPARDQTGQIVYEEVEGSGMPYVEKLTIFDFVTDGAKDVKRDGRWLLVQRWIDEDDARAMLKEAGYTDAAVQAQPVKDRADVKVLREAVEGWELWIRPGSRIAEGCFATIVGGKVLSAMPFPYKHGELPLQVWRQMDQGDEFYGDSWIFDAIPQQIGLNHALCVRSHRTEIAGQVRGISTKEVHDQWGPSQDGWIVLASKDDIKDSVGFVESPDIPRDMFEAEDRYEKGISDVAGVADVAGQGDVAAETKNARLVAYATQIDAQKDYLCLQNLNECAVQIDSQILKLVQQFVTAQRLWRIVGEDRAVDANWFSGAEIMGVDVVLEPAPATERLRASKGKAAEESVAGGFLDPRKGAEMRETGLDGTVDEGEARLRLQALVQRALNGEPVQADPSVPPPLALRELRAMLEQVAAKGPQATMPIRALMQEYQEIGQQARSQMQQQGPQPGAQPQRRPNRPQPQAAVGNQLPETLIQ